MPEIEPYGKGSRVRYLEYTGVVYRVYSDGAVLIEWDDWPGLFFRGPYWPEELVDA